MHHAHNQSVVVVGGKVNMGSIESLTHLGNNNNATLVVGGQHNKGGKIVGGQGGHHQKHQSMNTRSGQSNSVDKKSLYRMINKK